MPSSGAIQFNHFQELMVLHHQVICFVMDLNFIKPALQVLHQVLQDIYLVI